MREEVVTKTVIQYSKELSAETIMALKEIAVDCSKVRNYVYGRYSGINSIEKLTPGYTVMNEMRHCGLRQQLNLPAVYYELAILDALRDIKSIWSNLKNKIAALVRKNENLSKDDKIYLFTVLKYGSAFNGIVSRKDFEIPNNTKGLQIDVKRLNNLLCRYVRKCKTTAKAGCKDRFTVSPNGYKYYNSGVIGFVSKIPRKRIKVELKDNDIHSRQLKICIKENYITIAAPVDVKVKHHKDYINTVCVHIGFSDMLTLSNGNVYGKELSKIINSETDRLRCKNAERQKHYKMFADSLKSGYKVKSIRIKKNNMGKKKYHLQKNSNHSKMVVFINSEINRMIENEKPCKIVIPKAVKTNLNGLSVRTKEKLTRSFNGYIRERLKYKCKINGIEVLEVNSHDISIMCCRCGVVGKKQNNNFVCTNCGYKSSKAINAARNIEKKYCTDEFYYGKP